MKNRIRTAVLAVSALSIAVGTRTALADSARSGAAACPDLCYDLWESCIASGGIDPYVCEDYYNRCMLHCRR